MSCMLRAWGRAFDVDQCLSKLSIDATKVYQRGEPRFRTRPTGARQRFSGFNSVVSGAERNQLARQLREAEQYVRTHARLLRRLRKWPGVEGVELDFGVEWKRDAVVQSSCIPESLVAAAARAGVALEITMYPCSAADSSTGRIGRRKARGRRTSGCS
jgi:hypothetical protein